jgi:hypothetical protein
MKNADGQRDREEDRSIMHSFYAVGAKKAAMIRYV